MKTYIALLRGINVGGKNRLPMTDLVVVLENLGLKEVQTYIQSGNVVFQSAESKPRDLAQIIGDAVIKSCKVSPQIVVLPFNDFQDAVNANPFHKAENDPKTLHLFFGESKPENPDWHKLKLLKKNEEQFELKGKVFYLHCPQGIGSSKLAAKVEKVLGVAMTARNWRSVLAVLSLASGIDSNK
ncbi:MAG: DUF1697 domain-containing protein [bacterium]|nr:DUF1697 domain-containing protein [bacterium]